MLQEIQYSKLECKNISQVNRFLTVLFTTVIILWRIPFLNKGIDYTDTGFNIVNYQNVFNGDGIHGIGYFVTTLLGGILYNLFPSMQLLIFRILHWLICLANIFLAYRIFRPYINKNLLLFILLIISLD